MRRVIVVALALAASPARAEPTELTFDVLFGDTAMTGARGDTWSGGFASRFGGSLRHGAWAIVARFDLDTLTSTATPRDGTELLSIGGSADLALYPHHGRWEPYLLFGVHAERMIGDQDVTRTCHQTGACLGGTWTETPSYDSSGLELGAGLQLIGREPTVGVFAARLEAVLASSTIALPGSGPTPGATLFIGFGGSFGGSLGR